MPGFFRGLCFAVPIGLAMWTVAILLAVSL
jgi:hypothetical protein